MACGHGHNPIAERALRKLDLPGGGEGVRARARAPRHGPNRRCDDRASHAGDLIGERSLAMTNKFGLGGIGASIHPYPTPAEAIRKVGDLSRRPRLRPFVKRPFSRWLAWQRR